MPNVRADAERSRSKVHPVMSDGLAWDRGEPMIRREQAERTREVLLDAAAAEFCLHGLGGTRIQDVLDRTGLTRGGIYHHFADKQDMAIALAVAEADRWPEALDAASADARGLAALRSIIATVIGRLDDDVRARAVLRIGGELNDPRLAVTGFDVWNDAVIRALQQAIADGEVSDAIEIRGVAATVVDALYGVCISPAAASAAASVSVRADRLSALVESGVRGIAR